MVEPQTSRFWQAALQSGLVGAEALTACWEAIPPEKRAPDQLDRRLARQAVQSGALTLWQAQQILAGKSGFKIDKYVLLEMIGQGGMGRVYLAKDTRLNRRVALKILSPERVNNPRAIQRFQREARVGAQLQHENLVRMYDEGEANGKCYLVMEYIEGKNIGALIAENGPMRPSTAARLARQVALGLEHAKEKGLIHRDVNPYNILVTRDGVAKLTDLGLAIDLSEGVQVTREGATVGTFDYISPEQARHSHSVDSRSDIYSLGCTLYHMVSGQVPFPSPSLPEKLFGHQAVEPESLTTLIPGFPEGLAEVIRKTLRKSPDERYASPIELAQALEPFIDDQGPSYRDGVVAPAKPSGARSSSTDTKITPATGTDPRQAPDIEGRSPSPMPIVSDLPQRFAAVVAAEARRSGETAAGQGLKLGPAPARPDASKASPKATPATEAPPGPARTPRPSADAPDFARIGDEEEPTDDLSGLALGLDLGPRLSQPEPPARATPKARERTTPRDEPPAPAPVPEVKSRPAQAPVPDITGLTGIGNEEAPADDLSGLNLDFGPRPPTADVPSKVKPKTRPARPPELPAAPKAAKPATATPAPRAVPPPTPPPEPAGAVPLDFGRIGEDGPKEEDLSGLGLALNLGPAPPEEPAARARPKAKPMPTVAAPTPATPAAPKAATPTAHEETAPDFTRLGEETPPEPDVSGLGLGLDFGPSPTPARAASPSRAATPPARPGPSAERPGAATGGRRPIDRRWVFGGAAALVLTGLIGGLLAGGVVRLPFDSKSPSSGTSKTTRPKSVVETVAIRPTEPEPTRKVIPRPPEIPPGEAIAVRAQDGTMEMERDLKGAMQRAIGSRGGVVLNNREPLRITEPINIGGGKLYVRAAEGARPVLEFVIKGNMSPLMIRTDATMTIEGVTIVARYSGPQKELPAVIEAGGNIVLDRCAFRAIGAPPGSRAVSAEAGMLVATGCWFEGFDKAVDIAAFGGSTATLKRCMFIRGKAGDPALGWAAQVRSMPGGFAKTGRRLVLEQCTAQGRGLLDLYGFSSESPFEVRITETAALVDALVGWGPVQEGPDASPKPPAPLSPEALLWSGLGNQFDVRGPSWVVFSPEGTPRLPEGPTDLVSWMKLGKETGPLPPPVKFATDPSALSDSPGPQDFAVVGQGARTAGADPSKVGPEPLP